MGISVGLYWKVFIMNDENNVNATPATLICYDDEDREHRFECANGFVSRVVSAIFHSDNMGCYSDARRVMEIMNDEASR